MQHKMEILLFVSLWEVEMYTIQDEEQQEIELQANRILQEKDEQSLDFVMSNEHGRWFVSRLLDRCSILSSMPTSNTNDLLIFEGKRRIGLEIMVAIQSQGLVEQRQQGEKEYADTIRKIDEWRKKQNE